MRSFWVATAYMTKINLKGLNTMGKRTLKVEILQGLPASGKSTYAKRCVDSRPTQMMRVNKDLARVQYFNDNWSKSNEKVVVRLRNIAILTALDLGRDVIVDDTNLEGNHIEVITDLVTTWGELNDTQVTVTVNDSFLDVPIEDCIARDRQRPNSVGSDVIRRMAKNLRVQRDAFVPAPIDPSKPSAVIVDMDGTMSQLNGRDPYNPAGCINDPEVWQVVKTVQMWHSEGYDIMVTSARDDRGRADTIKWLQDHEVPVGKLYLREFGDQRKDAIVKGEFLNEILKTHNVILALDDRDQVVDLWRKRGIRCFQVAPGDF
jgi:predicted kinase